MGRAGINGEARGRGEAQDELGEWSKYWQRRKRLHRPAAWSELGPGEAWQQQSGGGKRWRKSDLQQGPQWSASMWSRLRCDGLGEWRSR